MGSVFDFLGEKAEDVLPEGTGVFENSGFIGQVLAKHVYRFWSQEDLVLYTEELTLGEDYQRLGKVNSWFYYFTGRTVADEAADLLGSYASRHMWLWQMPTASVLNFRSEKAADAFGQLLYRDCSMATLASKYRHEYHMVTLPAIVDALARAAGFIEESVWNVHEILAGKPNEEFTDQFQAKMIGETSATVQDAEQFKVVLDAVNGNRAQAMDVIFGKVPAPTGVASIVEAGLQIHYTDSILWQRRAALWEVLGEHNPATYIPSGMAATDDGKDYETSAEKLVQCLGVSVKKWKHPMWARFHQVKDPRVDAVTSSGNRLSLPMVSEIFLTEADARAAAQADGVSVAASTTTAMSVDSPELPEGWEGNEDAWRATLTEEKKNAGGVLPTVPNLVAMGKMLSATPDQIKAWWEVV